jgi:hypothetical protein
VAPLVEIPFIQTFYCRDSFSSPASSSFKNQGIAFDKYHLMQHARFKQYELEDQLVMTMKHGTLLLEHKEYNMMLRLFAYQNFYVQVTSNYDSN